MSFQLPTAASPAPTSRGTARGVSSLYAAPSASTFAGASTQSRGGGNTTDPMTRERRAVVEANQQHEQLINELKFLSKKQAQRIEKLKLDTAVQLEHHAALRRVELEKRKSQAVENISDITPRLEVVRQQWNHAKQQNQGFEMQWGSMRAQFQQVKQRVDLLRDKITESRTGIEATRKVVNEMREHLHKLERDKAALRSRTQWTLQCAKKDEVYLANRVMEEEQYRNKVADTLSSMEIEYQAAQAQHQHELIPLKEDLRLLETYREQMKERTKELQKYCLELEGKLQNIEDSWLEKVHHYSEALERATTCDSLKNYVISHLEQALEKIKNENKKIKPRPKSGQLDAFWLSHAAAVWEYIVKLVSEERHSMQTRDDSSQLVLAETSQRNQQTKQMLTMVKSKVDGNGTERRELLQRITDLQFLLFEKKESEEQMIKYLQDLSYQLDEDLSQILHLTRKDGYDDYVSSTDGEEEATPTRPGAGELDFEVLEGEGVDDIAMLCSSVDLDPNDPSANETIHRMSHRPRGHIDSFAASRQAWLSRHAGKSSDAGPVRRQGVRASLMETVERALLDVQTKVAGEVISFVRNRESAIQQGKLDPRTERIQADPKYITRAKEINGRIERWVQQQKEAPVASRASGNFLASRTGSNLLANRPGGASASDPAGPVRIVLDGVRIPPEVARANAIDRAQYYLNACVKGYNFMMYLRRSMAPQLRHVFLTRDLTRLIARRVGAAAAVEGTDGDDELSIRVTDVVNVLLGHASDVFKDLRSLSRNPMREELAFSIVSSVGTTFDVECDSMDDRNYWAGAFVWIVNESRYGGVLATLYRAGKINVVDTIHRTGVNVEPRDRASLQVQIGGSA